MRRRPVSVARPLIPALVLWVGAPAAARAAPCNRPDVIDTVPPDEAENVPLNATLSALYPAAADYLDENVVFEQVGGDTLDLLGKYNENEGILSIEPPFGLEAGADYRIEWPELRGFGSATKGRGARVDFTAGDSEDVASPEFEGVTGVRWDLERNRDSCTDSVENRYVFHLDLAEAKDDGGRESLTLVVFQTRGPAIGDPEPVRVQRLPEPGERARVELAQQDAVGRICFAAIVRDLVGQASASGSTEVCAKTVEPPFFVGCRASRGRTRGSGVFLSATFLAAILPLRRRRRLSGRSGRA